MNTTWGAPSASPGSRDVRPSNHREPEATSSPYWTVWLTPVSTVARTVASSTSATGPGSSTSWNDRPSMSAASRTQEPGFSVTISRVPAVAVDHEQQVGQGIHDGAHAVLAAQQVRGVRSATRASSSAACCDHGALQPHLLGDVALDAEVADQAVRVVVQTDVVTLDVDRAAVEPALVGGQVQLSAVEELLPDRAAARHVVRRRSPWDAGPRTARGWRRTGRSMASLTRVTRWCSNT